MASPHVAGALALVAQLHPSFGPGALEHALATTADDRYTSGKDEVSGSGFVDAEAATSALDPVQLELYRDPFLIASTGDDEATITARLLDATGAPLAGETVSFVSDVGILSDAVVLTDAFGEATTALTVEDHFGAATVTASVLGDERSIRVIVEDDRVRVNDAHVVSADNRGGDFFFDASSSEPGFVRSEAGPVRKPGEEVRMSIYLGNRHFDDPKRASVTFSVTDPSGDPVPELAGSIEPVDVGFGFFLIWISETSVRSLKMRIPFDARHGRYELTVTATTEDSGKTDVVTRPFWVGKRPPALVVRDGYYFSAETLNYLDFSFPHLRSGIEDEIEALGVRVAYWDTSIYGTPPAGAMARYSTVVWLGDWDPLPSRRVEGYLNRGGNILLSSEQSGSYDRARGGTDFFLNQLRATGVLAPNFPDRNHQIFPPSITGAAGGILDGETLDIDSYDRGTTGEPTAVFTDELVLHNLGTDAAPMGSYSTGVFAPAQAGVTVDDGFARSIFLGFGIEAIDDGGSTIGVGDLLERVFDAFHPAPTIDYVVPRMPESGGRFLIEGTNLQPTGLTRVTLGGRSIDAEVFSREMMVARVPRGFPRGTHNLRIRNPFGQKVTVMDAVKVVAAPPKIQRFSPDLMSNHRAHSIRVRGSWFLRSSKVLLAGKRIPTRFVDRSVLVARVPEGFLPLGKATLAVETPDVGVDAIRNAVLVRYGFTETLREGDRDPGVPHLQRRLRKHGFFPDEQRITDFFGPVTTRALTRYQRWAGLEVTGVLAAATRRRLNEYP